MGLEPPDVVVRRLLASRRSSIGEQNVSISQSAEKPN